MIPIAKVYAMMTMSRGRDTAFQNFKLPLTPTDANTAAHDVGDGDAELNVCIGYQQKKDVNTNLAYINSKSPCVIISVSVLRACGLKVSWTIMDYQYFFFKYAEFWTSIFVVSFLCCCQIIRIHCTFQLPFFSLTLIIDVDTHLWQETVVNLVSGVEL